MKQKSFEQLLKEAIRVDRLTPLQFSGILRAHAKYEIQSEQLRKHSVMRPAQESALEGELLGNEAVAKGVSVEMCSCGAIGVTTRHGIDQCEECGKPA